MSFRPLNTTRDYYEAFLLGVRRAFTSIVPPDLWNVIIQDAELEWVMSKLPEREMVQKRIDDLNTLRVMTDGEYRYGNSVVPVILPVSPGYFPVPRKSSGYYDDTTGTITIGQDSYPVYLQGSRVDFRIGERWHPAILLRSDQKSSILNSVYASPRVGKIYYEMVGNLVKAYLPQGVTATGMNLEYYAYPRKTWFDQSSQADNVTFPAITAGKSPYQPGYGSINSLFEEYQKREIIDLAVRMFLENRSSERYKTMLNEMAIKQNKK